MEATSKLQHTSQESLPVYVHPDQTSDMKNVRLRHIQSNIPTEATSQPAHFILTTGDFQPNEKENDLRLMARYKHNKTRIIFLIFTALSYLLHTLRAYIPESIQATSNFWSSIKTSPITRVYTSDLRPSLFIENLLLRFAEHCQVFWLLYILSYIPRRTNSGYLYRNTDIFNSYLCFLLISVLSLQTSSQTHVPPEIACACLFLSFILLIIICRLVTVKLVKYADKYKSPGLPIDFMIIRYFVLNSLFLYTTSIGYLTICVSIECFGFHLDPTVTSPTSINTCTTIGLLIIFILLLIYFLLDRFVYETEFWPIWTPYLFIAIAFVCPPLRQFLFNEKDLITNNFNFYLLWIIFSTTILMISIRLYRQILIKYREMKRKSLFDSYIDQATLGSET